MMRIDPKQLNERAWLDRNGDPINIDRAWQKSDRVMADRCLADELLADFNASGDRRWYALRVDVGVREIELRDLLTAKRIDAVVPVKSVAKPGYKGKGWTFIHKPVLRGRVFVNGAPGNRAFAGLLKVKGVAAIVGAGEKPYPIRDRDMNVFMALAQDGAFDERRSPGGLKVGDKVRIRVGAYADVEGVLQGYVGSRAARVETMLFGGVMTVDVTLAHIEKIA